MIRPARSEEAAVVRGIVHDAYSHYVPRIGKLPGPMLDDYAARIAAGQVWVLEDEGRICGILVLEDQSSALLLDNIAVAPSAQGKGCGRRLMAFAEEEARRRGHDAIILYTHVLMTENVALYRRAGYAETGRVSEKGFERVYMRKNLPSQAGAAAR
jgi:GNAT superfamily N-acetyltransferase